MSNLSKSDKQVIKTILDKKFKPISQKIDKIQEESRILSKKEIANLVGIVSEIEILQNKQSNQISQKIDSIINNIKEINKDNITQPSFRFESSHEYIGGKRVTIGIPKKNKLHYHGSSYILDCDTNLNCNLYGMCVTDKDKIDNITNELKLMNCEIIDVHRYDSPNVKSSHIHFSCKNEHIENIQKIIEILI